MGSTFFFWIMVAVLLVALLWVARSRPRRKREPPVSHAPRGDLRTQERAEDEHPGNVRQ